MSKKESNVSVAVRIRPRNEKEMKAEMPISFTPDGACQDVQELNEHGDVVKSWSFDHVFGPSCSNEFIFNTMGSKLVDAAIDGYNTVLFMYGQTSSGKTFTLFGGGGIAGVVEHTMEALYARIMNSTDSEYVVKVTYAELYNEELKDLLAPTQAIGSIGNTNTNNNSSNNTNNTHDGGGLKIIDDPHLGPLIQNITEVNFTNATNIKQLLDEGESRRHFGVTNMNAHSSRSHVMVRLSIEMRKVTMKSNHTSPLRQSWGDRDKPTCVSTLNLVDLAGSERAAKSGTSGQSLKEGSFINKSLLTLGTVISNLSEGKQGIHIPYRNSKLTRLLASALGGNAKTCMITCISPAAGNILESLSTLRFASRAKRIVNLVQKNELLNLKTLTSKLASQNLEMDMLRAQLEQLKSIGVSLEDYQDSAGITLKDKAINMSKNMRNLRFLMTNGSKIVHKLKENGNVTIAKKVQKGIQLGLIGKADLNEVIEEQTSIIQQYLVHEHKLLLKIQLLNEENGSDHIISSAIITDQDLYGDEYDIGTFPDTEDTEDELDFGSDELKEELHHEQFAAEDIRSAAMRRIYNQEHQLLELFSKEKQTLQVINEQKNSLQEQDDIIKKHLLNEKNLSEHLDEMKSQSQQVIDKSNQHIQDLMNQIGTLELQLGDKDAEIRAKKYELVGNQSDVEKLKTQCEQLSKDLEHAISARKELEEEASKARNNMQMQMDRLRSNMHNMLLQGGQESKVIEGYNAVLQKSLDTANDSLLLVTATKTELEINVSQLTSQISILRDEYKSHMHEVTILKNENLDLTQKLRECKLDNSKLLSTLTVTEQYCEKIERQLVNEIRLKAEEKEHLVIDHKNEISKLKAKIIELQILLDKNESELGYVKNEMESKILLAIRLEHSIHADTIRFEKKLSIQSKSYDELVIAYNNLTTQLQSLTFKHTEEMKGLKNKNQELQAIIDSITKHLKTQNEDNYDDNIIDKNDGSIEGSDVDDSNINIDEGYHSNRNSIKESNHYQAYNTKSSKHHEIIDPQQSFVNNNTTTSSLSLLFNSNVKSSYQHNDYMIDDDVIDLDCVDHEDEYDSDNQKSYSNIHKSSNNKSNSSITKSDHPNTFFRKNSISFDDNVTTAILPTNSNNSSNSSSQYIALKSHSRSFIMDQLDRNIESPQFIRIIQGMNLLTSLLMYTFKDDQLLRKFMSSSQLSYVTQIETDSRTIQNLLDYKDYLEENYNHLKDMIEFKNDVEEKTQIKLQLLNQDYNSLQDKYDQLLKKDQSFINNNTKYEQLYADLKVQHEKIKLDKMNYMNDSLDVNVQNMNLTSKIEDLIDNNSILQSNIDLYIQELTILRFERDELMKRFMREGSYELSSSTNKNTPYPSETNKNTAYPSEAMVSTFSPNSKDIDYYHDTTSINNSPSSISLNLLSTDKNTLFNRSTVWTSPLKQVIYQEDKNHLK